MALEINFVFNTFQLILSVKNNKFVLIEIDLFCCFEKEKLDRPIPVWLQKYEQKNENKVSRCWSLCLVLGGGKTTLYRDYTVNEFGSVRRENMAFLGF